MRPRTVGAVGTSLAVAFVGAKAARTTEGHRCVPLFRTGPTDVTSRPLARHPGSKRGVSIGEVPLSAGSLLWDEDCPEQMPGSVLEPHALMPRATARRGTRRMAPAISAVVGRQLARTRAMDLIASGGLDPGGCRVVWNVSGRAVIHPVAQVQVPPMESLHPVRRIGTFKGAESRISMLPVARGGKVTMIEMDSNLEAHHGTELSMDRRVSEIFCQGTVGIAQWRT